MWLRRFGTRGTAPFFSSRLADTGSTSTSRGGGLRTALQQQVRGRARGAQFHGTRLWEPRVPADPHGQGRPHPHQYPRAPGRLPPWAGWAAFWADIQMYATARSLGGRHPVVIAGDTNIYMDAIINAATEHFRAGREACGFQRAAEGGMEYMTPTLHPSRRQVDTFLVNEPLLPWSLLGSVSARGTVHPQQIGSDHLPVRLALLGFLDTAGLAAVPTPYSHT